MERLAIKLKGGFTIAFSEDSSNRLRIDELSKDGVNFLLKPSPLLALETREGNHAGCHCEKFVATPFAETAKLVSSKVEESEEASSIIFVQSDGTVEATSYITAYKDCPALRIKHTLKALAGKSATIENVSSFYIQNFGSENRERIHEGMEISYARNSWCSEGQWKVRSFYDEGLFNASKRMSSHRFLLHPTGSWSSADYLPMLLIKDGNKGIAIMGEVENPSNWAIEVGDNDNLFYASFGGPNWNDCHFAKEIKGVETFETVPATISFGTDHESCTGAMVKARRHFVKRSVDLEELPVIYNDFMHGLWGTQKEEDILSLIEGAKEAGAETFVLDAGWFDGSPVWPSKIGVWKEDPSNYPNLGLKGLLNKIREAGMKVGIWTEIENVGLKSDILKELPMECFFQVDGKPIIRNGRYGLNLANEKAYQHALSTLSELISAYDIDYLKNDYNVSIGPGGGEKAPGLGLLEHGRALLRLLSELQERFPNLTIESCASGGMRMDYGMLSICPIQSTSDNEEFEYLPSLIPGVLTAVNPEQAGIWAYPKHSRAKEISDETVILSMSLPQVGRFHLASKLGMLTEHQRALVKEGIDFYKAHRSLRKEAVPIYPKGICNIFDDEAIVGILGEKEGVLTLVNMNDKPRKITLNLQKYGINEATIGYPSSLGEDCSFDPRTGLLNIELPSGISGRTILLKK